MISFVSDECFPLNTQQEFSLREEQDYSQIVDQWLGYEIDRCEQLCQNHKHLNPDKYDDFNQQSWIGLANQALQTPYTELRFILHLLKLEKNETVVDLGAAYARMGHIIGKHYPESNFVGYEYEAVRVKEANRTLNDYSYLNAKVYQQDISLESFTPIEAKYYFIYDYGSRRHIRKTLNDLRQIALKKQIVVVGRGVASRDEIDRNNAWLSQVNQAKHFERFSIYYS